MRPNCTRGYCLAELTQTSLRGHEYLSMPGRLIQRTGVLDCFRRGPGLNVESHRHQ